MPDAAIIVDKWHVVSKANDDLDNVRSRYRRGAKGKDKSNPHKGRLVMHMRGSKRSPMRRIALDAMLSARPLLRGGWQCKEGSTRSGTLRTVQRLRLHSMHGSLPVLRKDSTYWGFHTASAESRLTAVRHSTRRETRRADSHAARGTVTALLALSGAEGGLTADQYRPFLAKQGCARSTQQAAGAAFDFHMREAHL